MDEPTSPAAAVVGRYQFWAQGIANGAVTDVPGSYAADDLSVRGRNLGFLDDDPLVESFTTALAQFAGHPDQHVLRQLLWRKHTLLWAARSVAGLGGAYLELGAGDGFGVSVVDGALQRYGLAPRWHLFDTFSGPPVDAIDPRFGSTWFRHDDVVGEVRERFASRPHVQLHPGVLPDTLRAADTGPVAFAHIDLNNARSELEVLPVVWERMVPGGIIVLDDYGWYLFRRQHLVLRSVFAQHGIAVLESPTGQGVVVRSADPERLEVDVDALLALPTDSEPRRAEALLPSRHDPTDPVEFEAAIAYLDAQRTHLAQRGAQASADVERAMRTTFEVTGDAVLVSPTFTTTDRASARLFLQWCIDTLQQAIDRGAVGDTP